MITITLDLDTGVARLAQSTTLRAGFGAPVRLLTTRSGVASSPGPAPLWTLTLGTQSSAPAVLAYLDVFVSENESTFTGLLDANDTRLVTHLVGKQSAPVDLQLAWTDAPGERRATPNVTLSVQPPIGIGPQSSESGPSWLTEAQSDARYAMLSGPAPAVREITPASTWADIETGGRYVALEAVSISIVDSVKFNITVVNLANAEVLIYDSAEAYNITIYPGEFVQFHTVDAGNGQFSFSEVSRFRYDADAQAAADAAQAAADSKEPAQTLISQGDAEAGISTLTDRKWSVQRVWQAIAAWWGTAKAAAQTISGVWTFSAQATMPGYTVGGSGSSDILVRAEGDTRYARKRYVAIKPSLTIRNNTAALADDPHITVTVPAGTYRVTLAIIYQSTTTTPGLNFKLHATVAPTSQSVFLRGLWLRATNNIVAHAAGGPGVLVGGVVGAGASQIAPNCEGKYETIATFGAASTITLQWAQLAATVEDVYLHAGTYLLLEPM